MADDGFYDALSSLRDDLSSYIGRVDEASQERDRLEMIRREELSEDLQRIHRELSNRLKSLEEEVTALRQNLGELMVQVRDSFHELSRKSDELREATQQGAERLQDEVRTQGGHTHEGLKKVYSGAALTDVLSLQGEAKKNEIAIQRAVQERGTRLEQARIALEEKQEIFDKHFVLMVDGFSRQLGIVAQHIVELQESLNSQLSALAPDHDLEAYAAAEVSAGQRAANRWRRAALKGELERLDFKPMTQLRDLREGLLAFFGNERLAWLDAGDVPDEVDVATVPFVVVDGLSTAGGANRIFSGDITADDAYSTPSSARLLPAMSPRLRTVVKNWNSSNGTQVPQDMMHEIRLELDAMVSKGLLDAQDAQLMQQHFELYPLGILS